MIIYDVKTENGLTGAILEIDERRCPSGLALEFHWYPRPEGTLAWWCLEDGTSGEPVLVGAG